MRTKLLTFCLMLAYVGWAQRVEDMYRTFREVPDSTRTKTWWFHGENITTRAGITADLESFKRAGLQGVVYYDQQHGPGTPDALKSMSAEWWEMLKFAGQEAKRLGLTFDINISNGYVCGGPWITPDLSMQCLRSSEVTVRSGKHFQGMLPSLGKRELGTIAVMAFPVSPGTYETVGCLPEGFTATKPTTVLLAAFGRPFTARSMSYNMEGFSKGAQSIVNIPCDPQETFCGDRFTWSPPIGELEVSDDSLHWTKVTTLHAIYRTNSLRPNYTISFPAATGRYFRLYLHDWEPDAGRWQLIGDEWKYMKQRVQVPLKLYNVELSASARIDRWEERAACYTEYIRPSETPDFKGDEVIGPNRLVDLTPYVDASGRLDWIAPKGSDWRVVRFVNCATGGSVKHGRPNLMGLECDKLSSKAAEIHWQHYTKPILDTLRAAGISVGSVCMDSHEAGAQNWTHDFPAMFKKERGYDIRPWLPAMQGYIIGSVQATERFLQDLRRTIADGICNNYFATIQRLCKDEGVALTAQAMGNGQSICSDNLMAKGFVDRPQGEFWTRQHHGSYDTREAASAAHLYGKTIASAEAFTDFDYTHTFGSVKDEIDMETAMQVNEMVICASEFQPWTDPKRINTGWNRDYALTRVNPLWPFARPFFDYQARSSFMMRQGRPVIDVLVYAGDQAPMKMLAHRLPIIPEGYDFDVCTTHALHHAVRAQGRRLLSKGGCQYQLLAIEKSAVIRPETERLIAQWKAQGLPVYDNRTQPDTAMGAVLAAAGIRPDIGIRSRRTALDRVFVTHRQARDADIYFFVNHSETHVFNQHVILRTTYAVAEAWNALTGNRRRLVTERTNEGDLRIPLCLQPGEATFVVACASAAGNADYDPASRAIVNKETAVPVANPWLLTFDTTIGGPAKPVVTDSLFDLSTSQDPSIRFFSGLVTYDNTFRVSPVSGSRQILCLPGLKGVARILVNGREAGFIWCSPWEMDITDLVRKGNNTLRIEVRTTLANRLIGDAALPADQRQLWIYTQLYKANDSLQPVGIVGEVFIKSVCQKEIPKPRHSQR